MWRERVEMLEEAMQAAVQFQDSLQVYMTHTGHFHYWFVVMSDSCHCECAHRVLLHSLLIIDMMSFRCLVKWKMYVWTKDFTSLFQCILVKLEGNTIKTH